MIKIIWPEIELNYAGKTYSTTYIDKDLEIKDNKLWSNTELE